MHWGKDGGVESTVWGFFAIEIKRLFSAVLLRFDHGSRDAYHTHAFDCFSWVLRGKLIEYHLGGKTEVHEASWMPFITRKDTFHMVKVSGRAWVLSFRGPWVNEWLEYLPSERRYVMLTHGRKELT